MAVGIGLTLVSSLPFLKQEGAQLWPGVCECFQIVLDIVRVYGRVHIFLGEKFHGFLKSKSSGESGD